MPGLDTASEKIPRTVALCYVRQSVTRQGVPQRSPEQQRANIEAVCAQHGWQPLWFVEAAGHRSGFGEAQRPAWRRLKEWLHLPGVAALVANEPSRVYRRLYRMLQLVELLDAHEVRCLFASPQSLVRDLADPRDRMVLQVVATHDEHVVHQFSEQQRELLAARRARGQTCGMPPFGTLRDGDGYLALSPDGVWLLGNGCVVQGRAGERPPEVGATWRGYGDCAQRLLMLYARGADGRAGVAAQLNAEGWHFRTRRGEPRLVGQDDVRRVVANWPEYGGLVGFKRAKDRIAVAPDAFATAFVPEHTLFPAELLERVAEVAAQRRQAHRCRAPAHALALSGLCRCACCACGEDSMSSLHLRSHRRRGVPHYIHPPEGRCDTHTRSLPAEHVEREVEHLIDLLCLPAEALESRIRHAQRGLDAVDAEHHRQRVRLEARLARIRELYLTLEMDLAEYRARTAACRQALQQLNTRPRPTEHVFLLTACARDMQQLQAVWSTGTAAERNASIRRMFDDITIDLETGHITAFRLHDWAAPYLIACAEHVRDMPRPAETHAPIEDVDAASRLLLTHLYPATSPVRPVSRNEAWAARNRQLRMRYARGETLSDLAREFHLSPQRVHQIVHEDGWRDAPARSGLLKVA